MWMPIMRYSDLFLRLKKSPFRRGIKLNKEEKDLVQKYGLPIVKEHAYAFVQERLMQPGVKDGSQTPYHGHPVFKAQHATATCCRKCLFKWHKMPRYRELNVVEMDIIVSLIMRWISSKS